MNAHQECVRRLEQEFSLGCAADGTIDWLDERAHGRFAQHLGQSLTALAVPGTESKLVRMIEGARSARCEDWELSLVLDGKPTTLSARSEPFGEGFLLVGSLLPEALSTKFAVASEALGEIVTLQRQAVRDRREIEQKHEELSRAHAELADSNRGLQSLHSELEERSASLGRANDVKTRVVANVSHEFRTPINSILGISQLLLDRMDGELTEEQEKQLRFIRSSAASLGELVNDMLDLTRIEAGKQQLRVSKFSAEELLSSLRGVMRPLVTNERVALVIEPAPAELGFDTDQGRISQVLRNLVANALKFTTEGEVRVRVLDVGKGCAAFVVSDTGIGIAPAHHAEIFEEFSQIDGDVQRRVSGTGLGLSLSRRLAEVLGGSLSVKSELGHGATFTLTVPCTHEEVQTMKSIEHRSHQGEPGRAPVLVIEDDRQTLFLYERYLRDSGFLIVPARSIEDARSAIERVLPAAIVLDVILEGDSTWRFLEELKNDPRTKDIPVMVVTVIDRAKKARALGADEFWLKPVDGPRLIRRLTEMTRRDGRAKVLVIDDDEASRYVLRRLLAGTDFEVIETEDGNRGVELARSEQPNVILLDFVLGELTAFDVLDALKADPATRNIPVIIQTGKDLEQAERERLSRETTAILPKQNLSRELAITRIREALLKAGVREAAVSEEPAHAV